MTVDGAETFYRLTVDKPGGKINLINGNITVSNRMTLTSGNINIGSTNLVIPLLGSLAGGSSSSSVITEGTGSIKRHVNGATSFPIGAATSYLPIILNNTGSPDNFSANIFQSVQSVNLEKIISCRDGEGRHHFLEKYADGAERPQPDMVE